MQPPAFSFFAISSACNSQCGNTQTSCIETTVSLFSFSFCIVSSLVMRSFFVPTKNRGTGRDLSSQ